MSEANKQLLQRWFDEVWNHGRVEGIDEMFAGDGIAHGLADETGNPLRGPENFRVYHSQMRTAFPDIVVNVEDMVAEGDKVAARCSVRGKHGGDSFGVAATQTPVEFTGMTIVRIQNGKIVEAWNNFDFMKMYRQIGVL
jgi:steroid delta-isomerase-like uncharacterized protein